MARFSWVHYEALVRGEHLNSTEVSDRIRRETGKRIHPEIVEQNLPCVVNNSFKEQTAVCVFTLESAAADSNESAVLEYRVDGIEFELHASNAVESAVALLRTILQERSK
ncbi:hypothetical protein [uncultured Parasutterella sp.]|uniref:hypothetical protein n=1 Tax=uncultured Parasutterella sp. TaxID=1263098 RepID=UPI0025B7189F|nr:hypothetical protein [uncultured Parasutterella sp.]